MNQTSNLQDNNNNTIHCIKASGIMTTNTSAGETMMMEEPSATIATTETKQQQRRTLDEEDELNQSVNFLMNASATSDQTTAYSNILSRRTTSSSFGVDATQKQHHRTHTTGETRLSKIIMRVVFGSCMFTIFTTLVRVSVKV